MGSTIPLDSSDGFSKITYLSWFHIQAVLCMGCVDVYVDACICSRAYVRENTSMAEPYHENCSRCLFRCQCLITDSV